MTIYHQNTDSFITAKKQLIPIIKKITNPDIIFLLGASRYSRRSESIFNSLAPTSHHISDYFLLILLPDMEGKPGHEWQDKIEQHCAKVTTVTTIIMETPAFIQWHNEGHAFARRVYESAVPFYVSSSFTLPELPEPEDIDTEDKIKKVFIAGANKASEFLAGAELYHLRNQHAIAAFMLHQSAEQALRTLLKIGIGFHINSHNLERILRYTNLITPKVQDIFSQRTEQDRRLFNLLQKAYSDARYNSDYQIRSKELIQLTGKVKLLLKLLNEEGDRWIKCRQEENQVNVR